MREEEVFRGAIWRGCRVQSVRVVCFVLVDCIGRGVKGIRPSDCLSPLLHFLLSPCWKKAGVGEKSVVAVTLSHLGNGGWGLIYGRPRPDRPTLLWMGG